MCVCVKVMSVREEVCVIHSECVEVRGQPCRVSSSLPPVCELWEWNLGCQVCWAISLMQNANIFNVFNLQLAKFMHIESTDREVHPCNINTIYQHITSSFFYMHQNEWPKLRKFKQYKPQFMITSHWHLFLSLSYSLRTQQTSFLPRNLPFVVPW